jgi:hypothetical protein
MQLVHDQALAANPAIDIVGPFAPADAGTETSAEFVLGVPMSAPVYWSVPCTGGPHPPGGV